MAVEFRGCKNLVYAEVTQDNASGYVTGEVKPLAPVAEISKSVETSSAAHYYDNKAAIVINTEGADTVTFTIAVPDPETYAELTGRTYDSTKKTFIESKRVQRYFAVGYVLGEVGEGDEERYVWRYKGSFNIPDETSQTENDSTDANNLSLQYTGIYTMYEFENGKGEGVAGSAKAMFVRKSDNVASESTFFADVVTPDTALPLYKLSIVQAAGTTITVDRNHDSHDVLSDGDIIHDGDDLNITVTNGTVKVNGQAFTSGEDYRVTGDTRIVSSHS